MRRGFTLLEIIIVVGIIALLFAIGVPVFNGVMAQSRSAVSKSNLRQWGVANTNFLNDHDQILPWQGLLSASSADVAEMQFNFDEDLWWANALSTYAGQPPYRETSATAVAQSSTVPLPPTKSIYCDPQADNPTGPHKRGNLQFYFNYVYNSGLHDDITDIYAAATTNEEEVDLRLPMARLDQPARTVLMTEMRANEAEVPEDINKVTTYYQMRNLDRHIGTWDRFAGRHRGGGHILFVDGAVSWFDLHYIVTDDGGMIDPMGSGDWNKQNVIWNPLAAAEASMN
ncbi:MAG: prepilin-type N-terminal cleavage/methylation domain-containing protein [Phycisphaerales bacterium]|nr:prepilin-type N-terminal cleavage/methylation domain-containing protein [Phycisphaerales bacterium]